MADLFSKPVWAGVALMFPDGQIFSWQLDHPEARISVTQRMESFRSWDGMGQASPLETYIDIAVKGSANFWTPPADRPGLVIPIERGQGVLPGNDGRAITVD